VSIFKRLRQFLRGRSAQYPLYADHHISHDRDGLTLEQAAGGIVGRFAWPEVQGAIAFKRDLLTTDMVCIEFALETSSFEINEETPGWQTVVEVLPAYLLGARPYAEWWPKVQQPPFEASTVTVFRRHAEHAAQQAIAPDRQQPGSN
jgi:hypothetical protein